MTEKEVELINTMESLVCDFENNIDQIASLVRNCEISLSLGTNLIYSDTCCKTARQYRMLLFVIMLKESSNLESDWTTAYHLLKEAYIMTDNIYSQLQKSPYAFNLSDYLIEMKKHIDVEHLMQPEEIDFLNSLTFPLKVYRGMCNNEFSNGDFGVSWTDCEETAKKYVFYSKNNNDDSNGKIVVCTIERSEIFAVWGVNGKEKELIIPGCTSEGIIN